MPADCNTCPQSNVVSSIDKNYNSTARAMDVTFYLPTSNIDSLFHHRNHWEIVRAICTYNVQHTVALVDHERLFLTIF